MEGQTVAVGIAVANDKRTREGLYVGMSRGWQRNEVYAYPSAQEPAESAIGQPPAADPELTRQRRLQADRESARPAATAEAKDPLAILAPVVRRDDAEMSATETREQALSDADHLGTLHAIWMDQCRAEAYTRYAQAVREHAAPADAAEILKDTDRLWRTVRSAEMTGHDGGRAHPGSHGRTAIHRCPVALGRPGRAHPADTPVTSRPRPAPPGRPTLPKFTDAELTRYMTEVAAAMDDRQRRIGEHVAREAPLWATQALGHVPADPVERAEWEAKAAQLGAYREMFGWDHPGEAIGPEPAATFPEARAEWHAAFAVMARVGGHRRAPPDRRPAPRPPPGVRSRNIMGAQVRHRGTARRP